MGGEIVPETCGKTAIKENIEPYNNLYKQYKKLYDYFGTSKESIMKILKDIKIEVKTRKHS